MAGIITHIAFYVGWPKAWAAFNMAKESEKKDERRIRETKYIGLRKLKH